MPDTLRLLFVGIDGASHAVVASLMEQGKLPHLSALAATGIGGVLQSTFPPHTAPGWASMFTGVEPGEHGVYQFWSTQPGDYGAHTVNAHQYGREALWLALERHGWRVGVYNMPMTHPPRPLRGGYMISWPLSRTLRYSEPASLVAELAAAGLHHHSDLLTMYRGQSDYPEQARQFIAGRTDTALYLQQKRPVDALFVCYTEVDRVSHYYWSSSGAPGREVCEAYEQTDAALGRLLALADSRTLVVVASDHGFGHCTNDINVLPLLRDEGLLQLCATEPTQEAKRRGADDLSDASWFRGAQQTIDWSSTQVYMPTPGCFGLNLNLLGRDANGIVTSAMRRGIEARLHRIFSSLRDERGTQLFEVVRREEIYRGRFASGAPDYLLVPSRWDLMPTQAFDDNVWLPPAQHGVHRPDGILFAAGGALPANRPLFARIEDVTPFVLAHLGLPVPTELTGHWLVPPVSPVRFEEPESITVGRGLTAKEAAFMDQRLAEIGYLR